MENRCRKLTRVTQPFKREWRTSDREGNEHIGGLVELVVIARGSLGRLVRGGGSYNQSNEVVPLQKKLTFSLSCLAIHIVKTFDTEKLIIKRRRHNYSS